MYGPKKLYKCLQALSDASLARHRVPQFRRQTRIYSLVRHRVRACVSWLGGMAAVRRAGWTMKRYEKQLKTCM